MSAKEKLVMAELTRRSPQELQTMISNAQEDLRKARFKHALGQLKETHTLRHGRRQVAKLQTALGVLSRESGEKA